MYRVLIVDDEAGHRKGLLGMLCMVRPEYLVFEAENGQRALQMLEIMPFDLVITDIRMPLMDGLTFLELAKGRYPQTRFAMLSAFGLFDYAKQAMTRGADDYLVKPTDRDELCACLNRLEKRLEEQKSLEREQLQFQENLQQLRSSQMEDQLHRFVLGELSSTREAQMLAMLPKAEAGIFLYVQPACAGMESRMEEVKRLLRAGLGIQDRSVLYRCHAEGDALIVLWAGAAMDRGALEALLLEVVGEIQERCGVSLFIGASQCGQGFYGQLERLFLQAKASEKQRFFCPDQHIFIAGAEGAFDPFESIRLDVSIPTLCNLLSQGDTEGAYRLLTGEIEHTISTGQVFPSKLKEVLMYTLMFLLNALAGQIPQREHIEILTDANTTVLESLRYAQMLDSLRCLLQRIGRALRTEENQQERIMERARQFIEERYAESLSLESVAAEFHFHPSYFSTQFKKTLGRSFSECLQDVRMRKAAELLLQSGHSATQVSALVGFRDAAYFSKVFKKRYGTTPDQYRRRARR